jgi:acyl-CoA dehydrogenase
MAAIPAFAPFEAAALEGLPDQVNALRLALLRMLNEQVIPREPTLMRAVDDPEREALVFELREHARELGLDWPVLSGAATGTAALRSEVALQQLLGLSPWGAELCRARDPERGVAWLLAQLGNAEQQRDWLEPLKAGEQHACLAFAEQQSGSDLSSVSTTAVRKGDRLAVTGSKWLVEGAQAADFAIVLMRVDGELRLALVPLAAEGVRLARGLRPWGGAGPELPALELQDVGIGVDQLLGSAAQVSGALSALRVREQLLTAANATGRMWRAFDLMVKRATERQVHGGLLESKQFIRAFIADSLADMESASALVLRAAERLDAAGGVSVDGSVAADDQARTGALAIITRQNLHRVVDRAIQVLGALGVSGDAPLANMYMDARLARLKGEPDELLREAIAEHVLGHYHQGKAWDFS